MGLYDLIRTSVKPVYDALRMEVAYAYLRVSHQDSAERELSEQTQREMVEEYAARHNITIKHWYVDRAKSAFKKEPARKEFLRMLEDAKRDNEVTVVLCFKYDRFSRSDSAPGQQAELLEHNVRIISVTEGYYDPETEGGSMMMALTWSMNKMQSMKLRNVVTPNMKTNSRNRDPESSWSYKNGGLPMWGYKTHRIQIGKNRNYMDLRKAIWLLDDTIVAGKPVWEWARIMLVDWRLKQRLGYGEIAKRLTEAGVPTPHGKSAWCQSTIQSLIADFDKLYQYAGYGFWNRRNCQTGYSRDREPWEWIVVENAHPAIISEAECDAIYAIVTANAANGHGPKHSYSNKPRSRFILSGGSLICKRCGERFAGKKTDGDYYLCGNHIYRDGAGCGPSWYIPKDKVERLVFRKIMERIRGADVDRWVKKVNAETAAEWTVFKDSSEARAKRLRALETEMSNLINIAASVGKNEALVERIRQTQTAIDELKQLRGLKKPAKITTNDVLKRVEKLIKTIEGGDIVEKRSLVKRYVKQLMADPDNRIISGEILDPLAVLCANDDPEDDNSESPLCRRVVGQGKGTKTERMFV